MVGTDGSDEPRVVTPGFYRRVYAVVRQIPPGRVATYGLVGTILGSPRVARQVGFALAALDRLNDEPPVPWQRVINAKGMVSHRGDVVRAQRQVELLEREGVAFDDRGRVDLGTYLWDYVDVLVPPAT